MKEFVRVSGGVLGLAGLFAFFVSAPVWMVAIVFGVIVVYITWATCLLLKTTRNCDKDNVHHE